MGRVHFEPGSDYMSDSVRSPTFKAVLTASPRLVAPSFRKMLWRCVSIDGAANPRSAAIRFVVCPLAIPRRICISLEVRGARLLFDRGVDSATRRSTSGIIFRGTGLSLRRADNKARCNSPGPASFRTYPEQPTCIIRSRSSLDSDTVQATTLTFGFLVKTALAVAGPSMSGICTSMRIRSGFSASSTFRASAPDEASPTSRRLEAEPSIARAAARGRMLSSTTSTRCTFRSVADFGMRAA